MQVRNTPRGSLVSVLFNAAIEYVNVVVTARLHSYVKGCLYDRCSLHYS